MKTERNQKLESAMTEKKPILCLDFDGDETVFDQMIEGQQQNFRHNADAALAALKPGSRFSVDGVECVVVATRATPAQKSAGASVCGSHDIAHECWDRMLRACEEKS